jgi:hypothetical protein
MIDMKAETMFLQTIAQLDLMKERMVVSNVSTTHHIGNWNTQI